MKVLHAFAARFLGLVGFLWATMLFWPLATHAQVLELDAQHADHDAWRVATVLFDPGGSLGVVQALERTEAFKVLDAPAGNLGRRSGAVWLRVPVEVPAGGSGRWVLEVDYAPLDQIDVYVLDGTRVERQARLGDHVPMPERLEPARSHILSLDLPPGAERILLMRVQTTGSLLAPLWLRTPSGYQVSEAREQALQGLIAGMGLCLMLYSLVQWASLRDPLFGLYALALGGTGAFFAALSGVGAQHLWGGNAWLVLNGPPFFILVGVCGAFFFVLRALEVRELRPRVAALMAASGSLAGLAALAFLAGGLSYSAAQGIGMALGPLPLLLVVPVAFQRLREGDRAAAFLLAGWGIYSLGVLAIVGLLVGWLPVHFWTLHAFQFASLLEMVMWMFVLGERVQRIRRGAATLRGERDRMSSLAHTDPLTGLLNRRGLDEALASLLAARTEQGALAVFMMDLDDFKPINDVHGHDTGDALLVAVAQRLTAALRAQDVVCRLGGDEFVFVVGGLGEPSEADRVGRNVLQAFEQPFEVNDILCPVKITLGYALAPHDDLRAAGLLKLADAAMYEGKRAGKGCLRRADPLIAPVDI